SAVDLIAGHPLKGHSGLLRALDHSSPRALVLWRTSLLAERRPPPSSLGHPPRTAADTIRDPKRSAPLGSRRRERLRSDSSRHVLPSRDLVTRKQLNGYPDRYNQALAFSAILYPASRRHSLRFAFRSRRRRSGLPRFTTITGL